MNPGKVSLTVSCFIYTLILYIEGEYILKIYKKIMHSSVLIKNLFPLATVAKITIFHVAINFELSMKNYIFLLATVAKTKYLL